MRFALLLLLFVFATMNVAAQTFRTIAIDPIQDAEPDMGCTLREAISVANAGLTDALGCIATENGTGIPIDYRLELSNYTYTLSGTRGDDTNATGDLDVQARMTVAGISTDLTVIDGANVDRVFHLLVAGADLTLESLTVSGGNVNTTDGAGILNDGGTLTIVEAEISNNRSNQGLGGGIYNNNEGALIVRDSTIQGNSAEFGGGVYSRGASLEIIGTEVLGNLATVSNGGGIFVFRGSAIIRGSTIADNFAGFRGGGLHLQGFSGIVSPVVVANSAVVNNESMNSGGGIQSSSGGELLLDIANTTIAGNRGGGLCCNAMRITNSTITLNQVFGIDAGGEVSIKGSIVAGNQGDDCTGDVISEGFNLIGRNDGCLSGFPGGSPNANNDFVGTTVLPLDALLDTLTGTPPFSQPNIGSLARDAIPTVDCTYLASPGNPVFAAGDPLLSDQRGLPRDTMCDIGSVEVTDLLLRDGFED